MQYGHTLGCLSCAGWFGPINTLKTNAPRSCTCIDKNV